MVLIFSPNKKVVFLDGNREVVINPNVMSRAVRAAKISIRSGGGPFGAAIADFEGNVIVVASNGVTKRGDPTRHAEMNAFTKLAGIRRRGGVKDGHIFSNFVLYSTTEPCPMCASATHWARLPIVVYGTGIKEAKEAGLGELEFPMEQLASAPGSSIKVIIPGYMFKENLEIFKMWAELGNQVKNY